MAELTSDTHPIRVDFVAAEATGLPGRLGLTMAPGRRGHGWTGRWERDLEKDLERLRAAWGADTLVTLMEDPEMAADGIGDLPERTAAHGIRSRWFPITDTQVPASLAAAIELVREILTEMRAGRRVVVHCRGGLGRSGTVAACCLTALGHAPEGAITAVRSARPGAVENALQERFVARFAAAWAENAGAASGVGPASLDRYRGSLLGLAVGDALGTTLEFRAPGTFAPIETMVGGGPFGLAPGEWTDDTSLALCLAESLVTCRGFDPADQMERYARWSRTGEPGPRDHCFDIGTTTRQALQRYQQTGDPYSGMADPQAAGNGSLMRLCPVPLLFARSPEQAVARAADSSRTTHAARECLDACRYFAGLLVGAVQGRSKEEILSDGFAPVPGMWEAAPLTPTVAAVAAGSYKERNPPDITGSGHVVRTLEAALWAFYRTDTFREGALRVVNLGDDADSTGAVFGQIAGAFYGEAAIPVEWREGLFARERLCRAAEGLYALAVASEGEQWSRGS